jgi:hypothetical protein
LKSEVRTNTTIERHISNDDTVLYIHILFVCASSFNDVCFPRTSHVRNVKILYDGKRLYFVVRIIKVFSSIRNTSAVHRYKNFCNLNEISWNLTK